MPSRRGSGKLIFGIKQVDKGEISARRENEADVSSVSSSSECNRHLYPYGSCVRVGFLKVRY